VNSDRLLEEPDDTDTDYLAELDDTRAMDDADNWRKERERYGD